MYINSHIQAHWRRWEDQDTNKEEGADEGGGEQGDDRDE